MMRYFNQIKKQLLADKRKLGLMVTMFSIALLLWGRLLLRDVPRTATAQPDKKEVASAGDSDSSKVNTEQTKQRPVVWVRLYDTIDHDPFRFVSSYFPQIEDNTIRVSEQEKSASNQSDEVEKRQLAIMATKAAAKGLVLQSTLLGKTRRALINDELIGVGENINGFELLEVHSRQVVIGRDGIKIVLEMGE